MIIFIHYALPISHPSPPLPSSSHQRAIDMDTPWGLKNDTLQNKTEDCLLRDFRVWPSSCSETMIFHYKWISFVLGLAFTAALSFHFKNMAVRLIQSKFKINLKDSTVRINILGIMACIGGILRMSNQYGYHHSGFCISSVSSSLTTTFIIIIA
jgi:hypothetical protein